MAEVRNARGELVSTGPDAAAEEERKKNAAMAKAGTTAGAGLGAMEKKAKKPPPKAADYGGDMTAFGAAMRKYREEMEADPDVQARKKALSGMKK